MEVLKVLGITITACAVLLALKAYGRADMALLVSVAFSVLMLIWIAAQLGPVMEVIRDLMEQTKIGGDTIALLFKVTGVALISEFAGQICRDAGEGALAGKAELAGKVSVLLMALPLLVGLCQMALSLLP